MIYLDSLDSVKTAHPKSLSLEWWHPQTEIEQTASLGIAQASTMMRILMGETISLANNQMADSYAWLSLAEKMCDLDEIIPWAPFNFVYYDRESHPVNSNSLRKLMVDCFENKTYEFSAWVNLDSSQKDLIAKNLNKAIPQFNKMLSGFSLSLDRDLEDKLQQQADGLQRVFEYLIKWEKRRKVCQGTVLSDKLIWPRMQKLRDGLNGISGRILDDIHRLAGEDRLEYRSDIYKAIKEMGLDYQEREKLRMYIDRFYNEKLSISVSGGRGEFTMTDYTPDTTLEEDLVEDAEADKMNDPYGLLGQTVYDVVDNADSIMDSLTWDGMVQVLKEEKDLVQSARAYQTKVNQYYTLNPESPTYHNDYQTWLGRTIDELQRHRELLAQKLGKKVALDSSQHKFIAKLTPNLGAAAGGGAGWLVGTAYFDIAVVGFMTGAIAGLGAVLGVSILGDFIQKRIESRAVGRYRTSFNKSIQIRPDEELRR